MEAKATRKFWRPGWNDGNQNGDRESSRPTVISRVGSKATGGWLDSRQSLETLARTRQTTTAKLHHEILQPTVSTRNRPVTYLPHVTNIPTAAAVIIAAVPQPRIFVSGPLVRLPITFLLFETSMMMTISGGASTPLITAVQNSAVTGGILRKLISVPINVESTITR